MPPLAAWCSRWTVFSTMFKKSPINTKAVVAVLAIVWYILEIILKVVQLLR